jgi:enoyl-CoA hydratase/carnithine racemase
MDIRKGRMRFSATGISFGKAPKAAGITAMRIAARGTRSALPAAGIGGIPKDFGGILSRSERL